MKSTHGHRPKNVSKWKLFSRVLAREPTPKCSLKSGYMPHVKNRLDINGLYDI